MKTLIVKIKTLAAALPLVGILVACSGSGISIESPQIRETLPGQNLSVAYMKLINEAAASCRLEDVTAPGALVEVHRHLHENGRMKMRQVKNFEIGEGQEISFEPAGYHLMLLDLQSPLKAGSELPLTFNFGDCGMVVKNFSVVSLADS